MLSGSLTDASLLKAQRTYTYSKTPLALLSYSLETKKSYVTQGKRSDNFRFKISRDRIS